MGVFKEVTDNIISWLKQHSLVEQVTDGDISEIDISGVTDFPLAHVIYSSVDYQDGYTVFEYQILALDKFDNTTDRTKVEVLDEMNQVLTDFVASCRKGTLFKSFVRVQTEPTGEVMYDQLKNRLYGWALDISITVPSGAINVCK